MVDFGTRLRELRTSRGWTQAQLSARLGVTKSVVSAYETALRYPSYDILIRIAALFGVSSDYLLGIEAGADAGHHRPERRTCAARSPARRRASRLKPACSHPQQKIARFCGVFAYDAQMPAYTIPYITNRKGSGQHGENSRRARRRQSQRIAAFDRLFCRNAGHRTGQGSVRRRAGGGRGARAAGRTCW